MGRKGGRLHRRAGKIFLVTMLAMTTVALVIAVARDDRISITPAMLTFYLVASGWSIIAQRPGTSRPLDGMLMALALVTGMTGAALGISASHLPGGVDAKGFPATVYFVFGGIAWAAALLDLRLLLARGLKGAQRLARHLWRMGLAMLIATTSFFQGQEQVFPAAMRGGLLLKLPALGVVAMVAYWLGRLGLGGLRQVRRPRIAG